MISVQQFRSEVIDPALKALDLWSEAAARLVLGTAVHESGLACLRQMAGGPALGLFQIEPDTHKDLHDSFLRFRPELSRRLIDLSSPEPDLERQLITNLMYAAGVCRLIYFRSPRPLPDADDIEGLAATWKAVYNTYTGKGTTAAWLYHYRALVT